LPTFLLLAGPNGAGKSTVGDDLEIKNPSLIRMDPDRSYKRISESNPGYNNKQINQLLQDEFRRLTNLAYRERRDLLLETNLSGWEYLFQKEFKEAGYHTNLSFIALENTLLAIDRVEKRVAKGGHFVDQESIEENFRIGLINLKDQAHTFDEFNLYESGVEGKRPRWLFQLTHQGVIYQADSVKPFYQEIISTVKRNWDNERSLGLSY